MQVVVCFLCLRLIAVLFDSLIQVAFRKGNMGVPKLYRWLSERYPCLSEVVSDSQVTFQISFIFLSVYLFYRVVLQLLLLLIRFGIFKIHF